MDSNQLSMYSTLTFIYQIYLVMPAPPQFPDEYPARDLGELAEVTALQQGLCSLLWLSDNLDNALRTAVPVPSCPSIYSAFKARYK